MSKKIKRKIIKIDEDKCNGCGLCITGCPEQALQIVQTEKGPKARLVKEFYCDGLGACIGSCPEGAISIVEQEAEPYDEQATIKRIKEKAPEMFAYHIQHIKEHKQQTSKECNYSCPSVKEMKWQSESTPTTTNKINSELRQWPIQIHLVNPSAPYLKNAKIAIIADCVPFAYANTHQDFIKDYAVLIGCPKLDDTQAYIEKIANIIKTANPECIRIVHMEVPCCFGLTHLVKQAINIAKKEIALEEITVTIKGQKK